MLKLELKNKSENFATKKAFEKHKPKIHDCFCRPYPPIANTILGDKLKEFLESLSKT